MAKVKILLLIRDIPRDLLDEAGDKFDLKLKEFAIYAVPGFFLKTGVHKKGTFFASLKSVAEKQNPFSITLGEFSSPKENLVVGKYTPIYPVKDTFKRLKTFLVDISDGTIREPEFSVQIFIGPEKEHLRRKISATLGEKLSGRKLEIIGIEPQIFSPANNRWEPLGERILFEAKRPVS